jgi:hypothetical protein
MQIVRALKRKLQATNQQNKRKAEPVYDFQTTEILQGHCMTMLDELKKSMASLAIPKDFMLYVWQTSDGTMGGLDFSATVMIDRLSRLQMEVTSIDSNTNCNTNCMTGIEKPAFTCFAVDSRDSHTLADWIGRGVAIDPDEIQDWVAAKCTSEILLSREIPKSAVALTEQFMLPARALHQLTLEDTIFENVSSFL